MDPRTLTWCLAVSSLGSLGGGCLARTVAQPTSELQSGLRLPLVNYDIDTVDILFEIDNSNSMRDNQTQLSAQFGVLIDRLVNPPVNPATGRPQYPPVRSMHVGVISQDLGTPGSTVPSCDNTDVGDDGVMNPIRNGQALRVHPPWSAGVAAPPRPARCTSDPNQYPNFLTFDAASTDPAVFRDDFVCNALLYIHGCGLEAQLEAAYRALVVHDPHTRPGNADPNAGFLRDDALLALVLLTDEEDGSVRDCRYAERDAHGHTRPCQDALAVYDHNAPGWSSTDLNMRFYAYQPGSPQDPTWPLDRYVDPADPSRGFPGLKPGHPDRVIFAAITGVPIELPTLHNGGVDWTTLLGRNADGSDGMVGTAPEGPFSMRQANVDTQCTQPRTVPACRREGTRTDPAHPSCDTATQYFAWPARRIAQVARVFDDAWQNGTISSICRSDYSTALDQIVERIQKSLVGRCLPRALPTTPPGAPQGSAVTVNCTVRETLPPGHPADWCTAAHGRTPGPAQGGRDTCTVQQLTVSLGATTPPPGHGFYYDTSPDPRSPDCHQRIAFTPGDSVVLGGSAVIECVEASVADGGA